MHEDDDRNEKQTNFGVDDIFDNNVIEQLRHSTVTLTPTTLVTQATKIT